MEEQYPGITEQLNRFDQADLPSCVHCGSVNTASAQVGIIYWARNTARRVDEKAQTHPKREEKARPGRAFILRNGVK
jgi:hypothetical protein